MKNRFLSTAMAAVMSVCALGIFPNTASAAEVQEYNIPVTMQKYDNPDDKSMGNAALEQMGKVVVDESGNASLQLSFDSLTYLGQQGYLGWLNLVTKTGTTPATVIEEYTDLYDSFNNSTLDTYDENLKSQWYPKTISIPVDAEYDDSGKLIGVKEDIITVQVYVPVMESITAGSGTQNAYLYLKDSLFTGSSITLDGSVKLNSYMNFSDTAINDTNAKLVISTPDGRSDTIKMSQLQKGENTNEYFATTRIPAKEMTTELTGQFIDGNGNVIETFTTNVASNAKQVISSTADEKYKVVAAELLNYGARAQVYFNYNYNASDSNLANNGLAVKRKNTYNNLEDTVFDSYTSSATGSISGISYYGSSLSFIADISIKHYFTLESGNISDHTFKVNGETTVPVYDEATGKYYVTVSGISAKNFDTDYTVTVDGTYTLDYCVFDYCCKAQSANKATLKKLTKTLYCLWTAAKAV